MTERRDEKDWPAALRGPRREEAIEELRGVLVRGLRGTFGGQVRGLDATVEDFAQDALIRILDNLDTFRGESRFMTWAQRIAVRVAYTELRRLRWRDVSLHEILERHERGGREPAELTDRATPSPEREAARRLMAQNVRRLVAEELTQRQREAMVAVMFEGMPMEEVARRMGTNRNALYKLLHDARKRLKARLEAEGWTPQELLDAFG